MISLNVFFSFLSSNFIVIQVQFSAFSLHPSLNPSPPHLLPVSTFTPPPIIVHVSFIIVPTNPSPFSPEMFLKCFKRLISVLWSDNFNISAYGKEKCYLHYSLIFSKLFLDNPQDGIMVMLVVSLMLLSKMASIHPCKKTVLGKVFG